MKAARELEEKSHRIRMGKLTNKQTERKSPRKEPVKEKSQSKPKGKRSGNKGGSSSKKKLNLFVNVNNGMNSEESQDDY